MNSVFKWQPICNSNSVFSQQQVIDLAALYGIKDISRKSKREICSELNAIWAEEQVAAVNQKTQCANDSNILFTEDVKDIPPQFFTTIQEGGKLWCFDVRELKKLVAAAKSSRVDPKNPFTNNVLPLDLVEKKIRRAEKFAFGFEDEEEEMNLSPSSRLSNLVADMLNVYSDQGISGMANPMFFIEKANKVDVVEFADALQLVFSEFTDEFISRLKSEDNEIVMKIALMEKLLPILKTAGDEDDTVILYEFIDQWNTMASMVDPIQLEQKCSLLKDKFRAVTEKSSRMAALLKKVGVSEYKTLFEFIEKTNEFKTIFQLPDERVMELMSIIPNISVLDSLPEERRVSEARNQLSAMIRSREAQIEQRINKAEAKQNDRLSKLNEEQRNRLLNLYSRYALLTMIAENAEEIAFLVVKCNHVFGNNRVFEAYSEYNNITVQESKERIGDELKPGKLTIAETAVFIRSLAIALRDDTVRKMTPLETPRKRRFLPGRSSERDGSPKRRFFSF